MQYQCNQTSCHSPDCPHKEPHNELPTCTGTCKNDSHCIPISTLPETNDLVLCEKCTSCKEICQHASPHESEPDCDKPTDCNAFCRPYQLSKPELQAKLNQLNQEMRNLDDKIEILIAEIQITEQLILTAPDAPPIYSKPIEQPDTIEQYANTLLNAKYLVYSDITGIFLSNALLTPQLYHIPRSDYENFSVATQNRIRKLLRSCGSLESAFLKYKETL